MPLSAEQALLRRTLDDLMRTACDPETNVDHEGVWLADLWQQLIEIGVPWLAVPDDSGGSGGTVADAAVAAAVGAEHAVPLPIAEVALVTGPLLADVGLAADDRIVTTSTAVGAALRAQVAGGELVVSGTLPAVAWGAHADLALVACASTDQQQLALVPLAAPEHVEVDAAGEQRTTVIIDGLVVPAGGWAEVPDAALMLAGAGAAARAVQISAALAAVLRLSVSHAASRVQFGRAIAEFQAVQHHLARIAGASAAAQSAAHLALRHLSGRDVRDAAAAKVVASEAAATARAAAHQVHGAMGMTRECPLHLWTRRLAQWRDDFGGERFWARVLTPTVATGPGPAWHRIVPAA